jgi:hypothetical protein
MGGALIAKSDAKSEEKLGLIFSIVDLRGIDELFGENFMEIINDLKTEYYLPPIESEYGVEKRFEECLQRANRRIHKLIAQSVNVIDLRGINAMIGLVYRNKIYLSHAGKAGAYLFHKKIKGDFATVDILGPGAGRVKPDQEKIFGNIISGEITNKDNLFFCNSILLQYFSASNLCRIIGENQLFEAMELIKSRLEDREAKDKFYAIVSQLQIFEDIPTASDIIASGQGSSIHSKPEKSINNLINTQQKTEKYLTPSSMPNWQKFLLLIARGLKILTGLIVKYAWLGAQKLVEGIIAGVRFVSQKIADYFEKKKKLKMLAAGIVETEISIEKNENGEPILTIEKESLTIIAEEQPEINKPSIPEKKEDYTRVKTSEVHLHGLKPKISRWLNDQLAKFVSWSIWQKILVIGAFVLFFFFSQSIVLNSQKTNHDVNINDVQKIVAQTNEFLNKAEAQNIFNDDAGAKASLAQAEASLATIPVKKQYESDRASIQARIDNLNHSLQKITYLDNPAVLADLTNKNGQAQTVGLASAGGLIFSFDNQNQKIYSIDQAKKQTNEKVLNLATSTVKKIVALSDKSLAILTDKNEIYQYDLATGAAKKALAVNTNVKDIESYGGKLYILEDNNVIKSLPVTGGFNSGSAWIKGNQDLKNSTAVAIGDGLYLTQADGTIKYFKNSATVPFSTSQINPPLVNPTQIFTTLESQYLFVLDPQNQRIVVFNKDGTLKLQITSKSFTNLKSMSVVEKTKKIYVLSDNKVYGVDITF